MITAEEVKKIAKLARLELDEKEIKRMQKDLSAILDYFNMLKKVKDEAKFVGALKEAGVMREDKAEPAPEELPKKIVDAAPDKKGGHVKVKSIF